MLSLRKGFMYVSLAMSAVKCPSCLCSREYSLLLLLSVIVGFFKTVFPDERIASFYMFSAKTSVPVEEALSGTSLTK